MLMQIISILGEAVYADCKIVIDSVVDTCGGEHVVSFYCENDDWVGHETLSGWGGTYCG